MRREGPEGQEHAVGAEGVVAAFDQLARGADGRSLDGADIGAVVAGHAAQAGLGKALEGAEAAEDGAEAGGGRRAGVERPRRGHRRPPLACE